MRQKLLAFVGHFCRDAYVEAEVSHLSKLFPVGYVPKAITKPGYPAFCRLRLQELLGGVQNGGITKLRKMLKSFWGDKPSSIPAPVAKGTVTNLIRLEAEVERLKNALKQRLPPSARATYEEQLGVSVSMMASLNREVEVSIASSAFYASQVYDMIHSMVDDVPTLSLGNAEFTATIKLINMDLMSWLPEIQVVESSIKVDGFSTTRKDRRRSSQENKVSTHYILHLWLVLMLEIYSWNLNRHW